MMYILLNYLLGKLDNLITLKSAKDLISIDNGSLYNVNTIEIFGLAIVFIKLGATTANKNIIVSSERYSFITSLGSISAGAVNIDHHGSGQIRIYPNISTNTVHLVSVANIR